MAQSQDYSKWSHEQLQDRLKQLDSKIERLEEQTAKFDILNPDSLARHADCVDSRPATSTRRNDRRKRMNIPKERRQKKEFDPSRYSNRLIALKLAYLGKNYNGFEYHPNNDTPLPTVEETLWHALMRAKLISPTHNPAIVDGEPNFDGCEYSKCGRTDKGVSAFGQVIGIRVRSNRPLSKAPAEPGANSKGVHKDEERDDARQVETAAVALHESEIADDVQSPSSVLTLAEETISFHPVDDEIPYCQVINRLLPSDIRVLAWCPSPPIDFSARFSCGERQYTYFFTQPAFTPTTGPQISPKFWKDDTQRRRREGYLDILAMQAAARKFEGTHDFRNFCKVDPSKQIDRFERYIFQASIVEQNSSDNTSMSNSPASYMTDPAFQELISPIQGTSPAPTRGPGSIDAHATSTPSVPGPKLYALHLHGNAFLWHQVRHMVAILFLIGQGFESPSLVDDLLNTSKNPCKPQYEMADGIPLVLWDCIFPRERTAEPGTGRLKDAMEWVYVGGGKASEPGLAHRVNGAAQGGVGRYGVGGVVDELWRVWRGRKMDEVLAGRMLDVVARQGNLEGNVLEEREDEGSGYAVDTVEELKKELKPASQRGGYSANSKSKGSGISISQKVFQGGDSIKYSGTYVPVLEKPRMEAVEIINQRYLEKKGFNSSEEMKAEGWRRVQR